MVHRNSIFNFLGQHVLLGALRHGRVCASSEAGSHAHLPNPAAQLLVLSAFLYQHAARGELTFGGCFHGGLTTDLTGTAQF